jgi:uncharacterized RDD family membrane protein YckC
VYPNDQVTIQTPEQITVDFDPAGIGSRFLALALDTVIQVVLFVGIVFGIALVPSAVGWIPEAWGPALAVICLFCIYWGYFAAFEILWHGQTPGKRVAGIRVVKDTGRPITAIEGIGRNLMRAVDGFAFYMVGVISVALSPQNKRLGDYVAGTIVIHDRKSSEIKPDWAMRSSGQESLHPELARLSEQDLVVVEAYLQRRLDLEGMVRINTAIQLADMVQRKTGVPKPLDQSDDDFLETTARQMRNQARLR